jgi:TPP-dependent pyruvate/acetoin dehydrogenase alpha subunit
MLPELPTDVLLARFRTMLRARRFDEALIELARDHPIGHFHVSIGQEVAAAMCVGALEPDDYAFTTHRNHGHLIARGADLRRLYAEILGRRDGYNRGKGGTLHLASAELGFPSTSASVGGCIPLAVGAAYALRARASRGTSLCLIGDGALEEGAFHESINIAALRSLPVVFLVENNSLEAAGQKANEYPSSTLAAARLTDLAAPFGVPAEAVDGTDAAALDRATRLAVARGRQGGGPTFLEVRTVRWPGSKPLWPALLTGVTDLAMAWDPARIPVEHADWHRSHDGLLRFARELLAGHAATRERLLEDDREARAEVAEALRRALESPYPDPAEALEHVFASGGPEHA